MRTIKIPLAIIALLLLLAAGTNAQNKGKQKEKEKAPTKTEMEEAMKEAEKMMEELDPEAKKMMEDMGLKPNFKEAKKNAASATDAGLKEAFEEENRIVPRRDAARIAAIPPAIAAGKMASYISSTNAKTNSLISADTRSATDKIYSKLTAVNRSSKYLGNAATGLWMLGYPAAAFYLMGKTCETDAGNKNNLSNYASMLSMLGAPQLAIPILNSLNREAPRNSTILNNLGQAWFNLGEISRAEKYLDSAISIYPFHSQANYTRASIEESKGNKSGAIAAVKKSIRNGYTKEKEEKLQKLGYKITADELPIPGNKKADPLNLGGFMPPPYPSTVEECVTLGREWKEFRSMIDDRIATLKKIAIEADTLSQKDMQKRMDQDIALVRNAMKNPGTQGSFTSVPLYADRAGRKLTAALEMYARKMNDHAMRVKSWLEGESIKLTSDYNEEMAKLEAEDEAQSGEGKPNADFCPKYREASDKYLKAYNPKAELLFKEFLEIQKILFNENAHWGTYMHWPATHRAMLAKWQIQWLQDLKANPPLQFKSITEFVCKPPKAGKKAALQKFDDVACQYHTSFKLPMSKMQFDCSRSVGEIDAGFASFKMELDADKQGGLLDKFVNCTIEVGAKIDRDVEAGPVNVGASAGGRVGVEIDRSGMKDLYVTGGAEAGVKIGDLGPDAGLEAKISLVSGKGSIGGSGIFKGLK